MASAANEDIEMYFVEDQYIITNTSATAPRSDRLRTKNRMLCAQESAHKALWRRLAQTERETYQKEFGNRKNLAREGDEMVSESSVRG